MQGYKKSYPSSHSHDLLPLKSANCVHCLCRSISTIMDAVDTAGTPAPSAPVPSPEQELQVQDGRLEEESIEYPTGFKFVVVLLAMCVSLILTGLVRFPPRSGLIDRIKNDSMLRVCSRIST
jgi:hypothetical protein